MTTSDDIFLSLAVTWLRTAAKACDSLASTSAKCIQLRICQHIPTYTNQMIIYSNIYQRLLQYMYDYLPSTNSISIHFTRHWLTCSCTCQYPHLQQQEAHTREGSHFSFTVGQHPLFLNKVVPFSFRTIALIIIIYRYYLPHSDHLQ